MTEKPLCKKVLTSDNPTFREFVNNVGCHSLLHIQDVYEHIERFGSEFTEVLDTKQYAFYLKKKDEIYGDLRDER